MKLITLQPAYSEKYVDNNRAENASIELYKLINIVIIHQSLQVDV